MGIGALINNSLNLFQSTALQPTPDAPAGAPPVAPWGDGPGDVALARCGLLRHLPLFLRRGAAPRATFAAPQQTAAAVVEGWCADAARAAVSGAAPRNGTAPRRARRDARRAPTAADACDAVAPPATRSVGCARAATSLGGPPGGRGAAAAAREVLSGARKGRDMPNFKGSSLGRFPLVSADFWTSDHLSERPRSVDAFSGTRARGTLTLKRR